MADDGKVSVVVAATNQEAAKNPLYHGEVSALMAYYDLPADSRPPPGECALLSTHEPCSMCASCVAWAGIPNVMTLFSYDDTARQGIPHDKAICLELFGTTKLQRSNKYFTVKDIADMCGDDAVLQARVAALHRRYDELSAEYQTSKDGSAIPRK